MYRVTASIGRQTVNDEELQAESRALRKHLQVDAEVTVDPVRAILVVVMHMPAGDHHAMAVVAWAAEELDRAMAAADLVGPGTIAHVEAEREPG